MPGDLSWASNPWVRAVRFKVVKDARPDVKHRPILFSAEMVRAIIDGRKNETRRAMSPQPVFDRDRMCWYQRPPKDPSGPGRERHYGSEDHFRRGVVVDFNPYGQPGDRLWVRETFMPLPLEAPPMGRRWGVVYGADGAQQELQAPEGYDPMLYNYERWSPSIHMPRWASRLTLEVVSVRVERLQEISEEDARAEGCTGHDPEPAAEGGTIYAWPGISSAPSARAHFAHLWDSINGARKVAPGRAA
jgi:hypothetical protein